MRKILSYGDVVLYESDLDLLSNGKWLNDKLISFASDYLVNNLPEEKREKVAIVSAPVTEMLKFIDEGAEVILGDLDLTSKDLVLFVICDSVDPSFVNGGTHWSLLSFNAKKYAFQCYDSTAGRSDRLAMLIYDRVRNLFTRPNDAPPTFCVESCPQQNNGYDCGVFVIYYIAELLKTGTVQKIASLDSSAFRKYWMNKINELVNAI